MNMENIKKSLILQKDPEYKVISIIVTYFPNLEKLEELIDRLYSQVERIIIVDNTERINIFTGFKYKNDKKIILICLGENLGIAKAQNIGMKKALELGAEYILLSDQDTLFPYDYVNNMLDIYVDISRKYKVGAIGPIFFDEIKQETSIILLEGICFLKKEIPKKGIYFCSYLIASGKIIPKEVLDNVGLMREELFIDWVDVEWCWRARSKGYKIVCTADVKINHTLGEKTINFLGKKRTLRSYIRHYYMIRNATYLLLYEKHINIKQKTYLLIKIIRWLIGLPIISSPRLTNLKFCIKGLIHGAKRKLGKYKD